VSVSTQTRPRWSDGIEDGPRPPLGLFVGLALALLLSELDQAVFATALPTVVGELGGVDRQLWVNTAYILTGTVSMPVYGKLGDLLGRRLVLLGALTVFLAGSVLGGLTSTMTMLVVARAVQGLGGGGLLVLVQAVVADTVPARRRAQVISAIGVVFAVASILGPVLGGLLTSTVGWRWAFWINLPFGTVALAAVWRWLPRRPVRPERRPLDVAGVLTMTVVVSALVLLTSCGVTSRWLSPSLLLTGSAAALVAFVAVERRAADPIIPLRLFARRTFTLGVGAGVILAAAMFGTIGYLPSYLQLASGLDPTRAGLLMLTLIAGLGAATVMAAQVLNRTGRPKALPVAGAVMVATALLLLSAMQPNTPLPAVGGYLFLLGAGIGCAWEVLVVVAQSAVPVNDVGVATATNGFLRELGVLLGSAAVGGSFTAGLRSRLDASAITAALPGQLTPANVAALPSPARDVVAAAYSDALTPIFGHLVPLVGVALLGLLFIRPQPLPVASPAGQRTEGADR
jgi:EmrB/QacA subfamily drug resistance transporter